MIHFPIQVQEVVHRLNNHGHTTLIVGGAVRDAILGVETLDFDLATSATPEEVEVVFPEVHFFKIGIRHGTIGFTIKPYTIEITTFRVETTYLDHRHPENVLYSKCFEEDVLRRDFTMNALGYYKNEIIDHVGGYLDIKQKMIRAVGSPILRFEEDALRVIRALRFKATYGFTIEKETNNALLEKVGLLQKIAIERILAEWTKLLLGAYVGSVLAEYLDIFPSWMPGLQKHLNHARKQVHLFKDALTFLNQASNLRFTAFLLIFYTNITPYSKKEHGLYFQKTSSTMMEEILDLLKKMKYSLKDQEEITSLVELVTMKWTDEEFVLKKQMNQNGPELLMNALDLKIAFSKANEQPYESLELLKEKIEILSSKFFRFKDLKYNGNDLIQLGFQEGPQLKEILINVWEKVLKGKLENNPQDIEDYVKKHH